MLSMLDFTVVEGFFKEKASYRNLPQNGAV